MKNRRRTKKSFFLRGLATLLPAVLTIVLFGLVVQVADKYVTRPINRTIYWSLESNALGWSILDELGIDPTDPEFLDVAALTPGTSLYYLEQTQGVGLAARKAFETELALHREAQFSFFRDLDELAIHRENLRDAVKDVVPPWIGILLSVLLVLTLGYLASGFLGRRAIAGFDRALHAIPIVRSVYPYAKQLVEFFLTDDSLEFDSVVAVPYPSEGLWSLGLVTGKGLRSINEAADSPVISVFMPTSPMPMTGYTVFVEVARVIPLDISVDEALRITVSGGVLVPPAEKVEHLETNLNLLRLEENQPAA